MLCFEFGSFVNINKKVDIGIHVLHMIFLDNFVEIKLYVFKKKINTVSDKK